MVNVTASHFPKTFSFEGSKYLLDLCLDDSRILYFWYVLESMHKFIIEPHVLQSLFVRGSNKNKGGLGLFQISQKERLFHLLWQPSALGGNLTMWLPFLEPLRKAFLSPSVWPRREHTWTLNWKQSLLILFWKLPGCFLFSGLGIGWWTLL